MPPYYRRPRQLLLAAALGATQLGATRCTAGTRAKSAVAVAGDARADSADQVLYGVRAVLTDKGVTKGLLRADSGFTHDDGTRVDVKGVTVTFQNLSGIKEAELTATDATYDLSGALFHARGNVVVVGTGGRRLQAPMVTFDVARNQLRSDSSYSLDDFNPARHSAGKGFESDTKLTKLSRPKVAQPEVKGASTKPVAKRPAP